MRSERQEALTVFFGTGCTYDADGGRTYQVFDSGRRGNGVDEAEGTSVPPLGARRLVEVTAGDVEAFLEEKSHDAEV